MKYQFCIRFNNIDVNSAASKAVLDCNKLFSEQGYKDYTITVGDNSNRFIYYTILARQLLSFFFAVKSKSVIGIQYPLLSINNVFKYFIKIARLKGVRFFCIIHDLESLRTGGKDPVLIKKEIMNLNCYDHLIVHNDFMMEWLTKAGVTKRMISLELFDYLSDDFNTDKDRDVKGNIVYAGNLSKSKFVYRLPELDKKHFNVYGPNFNAGLLRDITNVTWAGEYSPEEIPKQLKGSFGLIWDGQHIEVCDEVLGNYLRYNNPHKCSLYIAAGLPVIAPEQSAIGAFIKKHKIGYLITTLADLQTMNMDNETYCSMKDNVIQLREKVINGAFFRQALILLEKEYAGN